MTDAVRTADETLQGLSDFPFEPHYRQLDGLRLAHLDEGDGPPVVFFHGEPTWSFLWRKAIPPVRDDRGARLGWADPPAARRRASGPDRADRRARHRPVHGHQKMADAWTQFRNPRPKLVLWADCDPVLPLDVGRRFAASLGTDVDHVIADASHFLQEDAGPEIGALIADWLGSEV